MNLPAILKTVRKDAAAVWLRLSVLAFIALSNSAFAQTFTEENTPIIRLACNVYNLLSGPAAFLVGLIVVVVGGIAIAVGGKKVIGGVVWGIIGVGIAISAGQIAKSIIPDTDQFCV